MPDDDQQEICCILGICCGGRNEAKQKAALAAWLQREADVPADVAERVASRLVEAFDLAPAGTISRYRDAVAALAREYPYYES